jgi:hypothetical protein
MLLTTSLSFLSNRLYRLFYQQIKASKSIIPREPKYNGSDQTPIRIHCEFSENTTSNVREWRDGEKKFKTGDEIRKDKGKKGKRRREEKEGKNEKSSLGCGNNKC